MDGVSFVMSWDDGHPSDLRLAELLDRRGFRATFYLPILNAEGLPVIDSAAIRHIDSRFEIGSHTHDHRALTTWRDDGEALKSIAAGKRCLEDIVGHGVDGFCFPDGLFRRAHVQLARRAGVRHARTVVNFETVPENDGFLVGTSMQLYPHPRPVVLSNWLRHGRWRHRAGLARVAWLEPDLGARLVRSLETASATAGSVFHLWGHSWELDRFDGWRVLDEFLRLAADRVPVTSRMTVSEACRRQAVPRGAPPVRLKAVSTPDLRHHC